MSLFSTTAQSFNRKAFDAQVVTVATTYMTAAPTVEQWCDFLASAKDDQITLADIHLLQQLHAEQILDGPSAANRVYHLNHRLGRDTTGQAGS